MSKIDYKTAYENVMIANKMLEQENKQLKEEKKKAIEYIKENFDKTGICVSGSDLPYSYIEELLEILGDKENE